jgi:hypothetical protein
MKIKLVRDGQEIEFKARYVGSALKRNIFPKVIGNLVTQLEEVNQVWKNFLEDSVNVLTPIKLNPIFLWGQRNGFSPYRITDRYILLTRLHNVEIREVIYLNNVYVLPEKYVVTRDDVLLTALFFAPDNLRTGRLACFCNAEIKGEFFLLNTMPTPKEISPGFEVSLICTGDIPIDVNYTTPIGDQLAIIANRVNAFDMPCDSAKLIYNNQEDMANLRTYIIDGLGHDINCGIVKVAENDLV